MTAVLKRSREQDGDNEALAMANGLMLLSRPGRVFACRTCNREFPSFQALGGHRASHKKPRLTAADGDLLRFQTAEKPKTTHECSVCGVDFAIGQALMRKHRQAVGEKSVGGGKGNMFLDLDLNLTLAPMWLIA